MSKALRIDAKCDFCDNKAIADGKTKYGVWGYMCKNHLILNGYPLSEYLTTYIDGRDTRPTNRSEI